MEAIVRKRRLGPEEFIIRRRHRRLKMNFESTAVRKVNCGDVLYTAATYPNTCPQLSTRNLALSLAFDVKIFFKTFVTLRSLRRAHGARQETKTNWRKQGHLNRSVFSSHSL